MTEDLISVKDFSEKNGLHRQTVFKVIKRLGIDPEKSRGGRENRGQVISSISKRDAKLVLAELAPGKSTTNDLEVEGSSLPEAALYDVGVFYLLRLEPEYDPNRFKVGFASNLKERLRQHRCSAPYVEVVKTWPCRRLWEKTAIQCVTDGCEQLHTEVFRTESLVSVEKKCLHFFELMPNMVRGKPK